MIKEEEGVDAPTESNRNNTNIGCPTLKSFVDDRFSMFDGVMIATLDDIKEMS